MAATALADRHAVNLHGVLLCDDRVIATGTLPGSLLAQAIQHHPCKGRCALKFLQEMSKLIRLVQCSMLGST